MDETANATLHAIPVQGGSGRPRRCVITGGAGFIGGHLARALLARGDEVRVIDDLSTGQLSNVADLADHPFFHLFEGDVRDQQLVSRVLDGADVVFHLAAAVGVQFVVEDALATIEINVNGTETVLRAAAEQGTKVLVASTSEVYGKCASLPAREDDDVLLGASRHSRWSYASSKMVDELMALAYWRQRGLPVVVFRLFNTVGPRQTGRYGMVIPRLSAAALQGVPLPIYGDGNQSRSFCHVADTVAGIIALAEAPEAVGEVVNIGGSHEVTVLELAELVLRHAGVDGAVSDWVNFIPYEEAYAPGFEDVRRRVADTSKLQRLTGWSQTRTLDDILSDVVSDLRSRQVAEEPAAWVASS